MTGTNRFIVVTTINPPSRAIEAYASLRDWQLVVVGDRSTPSSWQCRGAIYLSPSDQKKLGLRVAKLTPWNHYCRKMIGYLYAMSQGAVLIADTDDDNIPLANWGCLPFEGEFPTVFGEGFKNIYKFFTDEFVWPRGYPLQHLLADRSTDELRTARSKVGVWQFLANGDPDVDAIYRMVFGKRINFRQNPAIVLGENLVSPFNSQNTFFTKEMFPLLYLPGYVSFRFTDILRSLVAQPIMWNCGCRLGFGPPTVRQERNPHDHLKDFESEIPVYLYSEKIVDSLREAIKRRVSIEDSIMIAYRVLLRNGIVKKQEIGLLKAWIEDLRDLS
jgi:hypothetical protein